MQHIQVRYPVKTNMMLSQHSQWFSTILQFYVYPYYFIDKKCFNYFVLCIEIYRFIYIHCSLFYTFLFVQIKMKLPATTTNLNTNAICVCMIESGLKLLRIPSHSK